MDANVRGRTIGQRIFSEIDDNPYLNKLYSGLLYNYAIKLFKLTGVEERPVKLMDVLRFADLLSKSDDPEKAESHHTWAQEMIALAEELNGESKVLRVFKDSVLSSTGNYQGLDLQFEKDSDYKVPRYDPLEQMFLNTTKKPIRFRLSLISISSMSRKASMTTLMISILVILLQRPWASRT